jgi:hypothetical protein
MIYTILAWNVLLGSSWLVGRWSLRWLWPQLSLSFSYATIAALWLGLGLQCLGFLTLALWLPLNTVAAVFFSLTTVGVVGMALRWRRRRPWAHWRWLVPVVVGTQLGWATLLMRPITWFDTGLYHLGAVQWLSTYGFVPGLALINEKFGFISAWFAFSAAVTPAFLGDHLGAVGNGFLVVLASLTVGLLYGAWRDQGRLWLDDMFLGLFLTGLTLFYGLAWVVGQSILLSFSNDIPVNYMAGIFVWLVLLLFRLNPSPTAVTHRDRGQGFLLPIAIAAIILSLKMTGLFLLPIAVALYLGQTRGSYRRWGLGLGLAIALILPLLGAQLLTSGCLFYPSHALCVSLPWTMPPEFIALEAAPVVAGGPLGGGDQGLWARLWQTWQLGHPRGWASLGVLLLLLGAIALRLRQRGQPPPGENWVLATALGGSLFIFLINRYVLFRFGGGVVLLLPIYLLAVGLYQGTGGHLTKVIPNRLTRGGLGSAHPGGRGATGPRSPRLMALLGGILLALAIANPVALRDHWLVPPPLPQPALFYDRSNDMVYTFPRDWTVKCWNAPLPCAPLPRKNRVHFRQPLKGLGGGFIYREVDELS